MKSPRKILIVDDYTDNREMYAEYLVHKGYEVVEAANGSEAIARAFAHAPDLVVMDLSLPGVDGWEATRRLKGDARTRRIPVLVVTGHARAEDAENARAAGCDAFLAKPCLPEDLYRKITEMLAASSDAKSSISSKKIARPKSKATGKK